MTKPVKTIEQEFIKSLHYSKKRVLGAEVELEAVLENGEAVKWGQVKKFFEDLIKQGLKPIRDRRGGPIVGVSFEKEKHGFADYIATDTGYCLIELAMAPEYDLHKVEKRYKQLRQLVIQTGRRYGMFFLSYGIQPITKPSFKLLAPRRRYRFFRQLFHSHYPGTTVIASNQSNINMKNQEEAIDCLNALLALVPVQFALFANSPIWRGQVHPRYKSIRPIFWYGAGEPWRVGMPMRPFRDLEDYLRHIWGLGTFLVKRGEKYFEVLGRPPFTFYLQYGGKGKEIGNKKVIKLEPARHDIEYHNGFIWWDSRIKTPEKTVYIENRACASQPPGEHLSVFAFHLGIVENIEKVKKILLNYRWQDLLDARYEVLTKTLRAKIGGEDVAVLTKKVLKTIEEALIKRKLGEEEYLKPLWERLAKKEAPADRMIKIYKKGGMKALLKACLLE